VLDSGNLTHMGAVTGFQLISIFGANLGRATGAAAPDGTDASIAGVSATFDGNNFAQLLYASATQINLAVPLPRPSRTVAPWPTATVMQLNVNGATVSRQFPYILTNLNLFANLMAGQSSCGGVSPSNQGYQPVANNADGTLNSCANPAPAGSTVSFYMHGIGASQLGFPPAGADRGFDGLGRILFRAGDQGGSNRRLRLPGGCYHSRFAIGLHWRTRSHSEVSVSGDLQLQRGDRRALYRTGPRSSQLEFRARGADDDDGIRNTVKKLSATSFEPGARGPRTAPAAQAGVQFTVCRPLGKRRHRSCRYR
jgi:uncharacterized protein (TIGR03437 family)